MKRSLFALAVAAALAPGIVLAASTAAPVAAAVAQEPIKAVYHINEIDKARGLLANVRNHLRDDPAARIVVIANGGGIDFLLRDAVDKSGVPFAPALEELSRQGVAFKVCRNTLTARKLTDSEVAEGVAVVAAGVAEIARLQAREGYVYIKP
ncbi:MAG: DsrE family protein [Burkholderiaceae bacterium]|nr:DsrE family protein [Burkholderiaceae bacterium]